LHASYLIGDRKLHIEQQKLGLL